MLNASTAANEVMNKTGRLLDRSTGISQIVDSHDKLVVSRNNFFKVAKVAEVVDCVRCPKQAAYCSFGGSTFTGRNLIQVLSI